MALANYTDLGTSVASWLNRASETAITGNIGDFVTLAESRIHYGAPDGTPFPSKPLRIRAMEKTVPLIINAVTDAGTIGGTANAITATGITAPALGSTYNFTALSTNTTATTLATVAVKTGSALDALTGGEIVAGAVAQVYHDGTQFVLMPGSAHVPLPSNFLAMRFFYIDGNPRQPIEYRTPQQLKAEYNYTAAGLPKTFTIEGDAIEFGAPPQSASVAMCGYYKKFPALATASTNWLMTNKPDVYLYASLLEAAIFLTDDGAMQRFGALYVGACNGLQDQDSLDRHSGGPLRIRTDGGTP